MTEKTQEKENKNTIPAKILERFEKYCKEKNIEGKEKEKRLKKLEEAWKKYIFEPGEAIGNIAAQSISEPATQMCTDYNEKIILKYKNKIKVVKIGEIVDKAIAEKFEIQNGYEIFDVPNNTEILTPSLSKDEK